MAPHSFAKQVAAIMEDGRRRIRHALTGASDADLARLAERPDGLTTLPREVAGELLRERGASL